MPAFGDRGGVGSALAVGGAVARLLRGAWRLHPPGGATAEDVARAAERSIVLGAAPLAWWQLRDGPHAHSVGGQALRAAYQLQVLQAARAQSCAAALAAMLRQSGNRALLIKGLAVAEWYPHPGLRPYGDHDLWVAPEDLVALRRSAQAAAQPLYLDLHTRFDGFDGRPFSELWEGSVALGSAGVLGLRTLAPEDHLRLLGIHLLRHGASKPMWLCDVALCLETASADFDWERCLGSAELWRQWLRTVLGLCVQLLGAHPGAAPWRKPPRWLCDAVLTAWGRGLGEPGFVLDRSLWRLWRKPATLWRGLRQRWPNPVQATVDLGAPLHAPAPLLAAPRVFLRRGGRWLARHARRSISGGLHTAFSRR